ncbi:MAG: RES family NAD+ phosphorylase [Dehalococcoidia bacterium]
MAIQVAVVPDDGLFRIGRWPNPLAFPPWEIAARKQNRFDDPHDRFRVLYRAETRLACFVETLAPYRPDGHVLAALRQVTPAEGEDELPEAGIIPSDWRRDRLMGRLNLDPGQQWLDLRLNEILESLRWELAESFRDLGYTAFDMSNALGSNRRLTQVIAGWAYDQHYQGIAYKSRFGSDLDCWAIFEGAGFEDTDIAPIPIDDRDLANAARRFMLRLSP